MMIALASDPEMSLEIFPYEIATAAHSNNMGLIAIIGSWRFITTQVPSIKSRASQKLASRVDFTKKGNLARGQIPF